MFWSYSIIRPMYQTKKILFFARYLTLLAILFVLSGCGEITGDSGGKISSAGSDITNGGINSYNLSGSNSSDGLTIEEAKKLVEVCTDLLNKAQSYNLPGQLPSYWSAACLLNIYAKESPTALVATGKVTLSQALDGLQEYATTCQQNKESALSLASNVDVVAGTPEAYNQLLQKMSDQLNLKTPVTSSSIGDIYLDCNTYNGST